MSQSAQVRPVEDDYVFPHLRYVVRWHESRKPKHKSFSLRSAAADFLQNMLVNGRSAGPFSKVHLIRARYSDGRALDDHRAYPVMDGPVAGRYLVRWRFGMNKCRQTALRDLRTALEVHRSTWGVHRGKRGFRMFPYIIVRMN
jgi:hypothetical protein